MTSFNIFKSIFNSSFEFYGLSEWLLELMPELDKSHNGQKIGRIQMKIFEQGCQLYNKYSPGIFDEKEIKKTFYWLYIWILKTFYNVKLTDDEYEEMSNQPQGQNSHDSNRCDGWCKYLNRNGNSLKRHTIMFK